MSITVTIIAIAALFYALGRAADLLVLGIRALSNTIGVKVFVLGIVLGFLTSVPELAIAIQAITANLPRLSVGNLIGGIFVLFGLVLGGSIVVNRNIATHGIVRAFFPIAVYVALPLLLALDGTLGILDGWVLILGYVVLVSYLYLRFARTGERVQPLSRDGLTRDLSLIVVGLVLVGASSYAIIHLTAALLQQFAIPTFLLGLVVFSLGTNLPEIFVTIRSWRKHIRELSLSNLLGSAIANIFIIGLLAASRTVSFTIDGSFYALLVLALTLLGALIFFGHTNERFTWREGVGLLMIYAVFLVLHSGLLVATCLGVVTC